MNYIFTGRETTEGSRESESHDVDFMFFFFYVNVHSLHMHYLFQVAHTYRQQDKKSVIIQFFAAFGSI